MSEALDQVSGIDQIPIFPLPLVLMPNEVLPLHIFEPRYRQMIRDVQAGNGLFGVNYFEAEESANDSPEHGSIGCLAEIRDVQNLPDGRANILTIGRLRYHLLGYVEDDAPYLQARVEFFEDETGADREVQKVADEVFVLFERIAKAAFDLGGGRGPLPEIRRADPESFSFLVSTSFDLSNQLKYEYLEMTSTLERLERLRLVLLEAVGPMEANAQILRSAKTNGHSNKKLEL